MNIRYRNTHEVRFERQTLVSRILSIAIGADVMGWGLDTMHGNGISIDTEGITLHLVKFSDQQETLDERAAAMSGLRIPSQRELRGVRP